MRERPGETLDRAEARAQGRGEETRGRRCSPPTAPLLSGNQEKRYQLQDGVTADEEGGRSEETGDAGELQWASWAAWRSPGVDVNLNREQSGGHVQPHGRAGMGQADDRISPGVGASSTERDKARKW